MQIISALQNNTTLFVILIFTTGLLVGSFLNVVIFRYPIMLFKDWGNMAKGILQEQGFKISGEAKDPFLLKEPFNLVTPRSRCPHCNHLIRAWENIPVISFLIQRAKCSQCQSPISFRYPFVELLTAISCGWIAWQFGVSWITAIYCVLTCLLIVQIFIDIDHKILPDSINYIILWGGLSASALGFTIELYDAVLGALIGYLSLWTFYWIFKILTKKEGMGYGDFKLLAAIGAFVGWQKLLVVIVLSAGVGSIIGIMMIVLKSLTKDTQIPFGPYLAIAGWITLFWGDNLVKIFYGL